MAFGMAAEQATPTRNARGVLTQDLPVEPAGRRMREGVASVRLTLPETEATRALEIVVGQGSSRPGSE